MWKQNVQILCLPLVRNFKPQNKKLLNDKISKLAHARKENCPTYKFNRSTASDRRVYVWGQGQTGALGINDTMMDQKMVNLIKHPTRLPFAERYNVVDFAAGYGFTLFAITPELDEKTLMGCGLNMDSQLGYQKLGGEYNKPMEIMIYPAPIALPRMNENENMNIKKVAAGRAHSIALSEAGILYMLGNNAFGQCARPIIENEEYSANKTINRFDPKDLIGENDAVKDIICGLDHSLFLTQNGKVYSCGWGADGQTGLGHYKSVSEWSIVEGDIKNEKIVKVACTFDCALALNEKGQIFGWGNSEYGQLGASDNIQQIGVPVNLGMSKKCGKIVDIAISGSACIVLNTRGEVFTWGFGLLGLGPEVRRAPKPTIIPPILFGRNDFCPDSKVESVYAGFSHFGAISNTKDLYMWGRNRSSCLGITHDKDQFFPLKVALNGKVEKIGCGIDHTVALCSAFM